jgi:hypothetical protein
MAEELKTSNQVKALFTRYQDIGANIGQLGTQVDAINQLNVTAGGNDDAVAKQYHSQVDQGGQVLTDLVTLLKVITDGIGVSGTQAADILSAGEADAQTLAKDWGSQS